MPSLYKGARTFPKIEVSAERNAIGLDEREQARMQPRKPRTGTSRAVFFRRSCGMLALLVIALVAGRLIRITSSDPLLSRAVRLPVRLQRGEACLAAGDYIVLIDTIPGCRGHTSRIDLKRLRRSSLAVFDQAFNTQFLSCSSISPDGKWLLATDGTSQPPTTIAAALDGSQCRRWPFRGFPTEWTPDSRCWLEWDMGVKGLQIRRHNLSAPGDKGVPLPLPSAGTSYPSGGFTPNNHLIAVNNGIGFLQLTPVLLDCDLNTRKMPVLKRPIPFSSGRQIVSLRISPDGERLVWQLRTEPSLNYIQQWMSALLGKRSLRSAGQRTTSLWVSRRDGSHLQPIGIEPADDSEDRMDLIGWMPDSKRLCVNYRHALWAIPVP